MFIKILHESFWARLGLTLFISINAIIGIALSFYLVTQLVVWLQGRVLF
jgi:hypothetical protein